MNNEVQYDGLFLDETGAWSERKHRLIAHYAQMFSKSMKLKWQCRIYIDLFSSSGHALIKNTKRIVKTSPLLSLGISHKFDRYIFVDIDSNKLDALKKRVERDFPEINVEYIRGDANNSIDEIFSKIPQYSSSFKVLSFCVVDPYKIDNLKFQTIKELSTRFMDFLILIPSFMDANRNPSFYIKPDNKIMEDFLGLPDWRQQWTKAAKQKNKFGNFVLQKFIDQMTGLNFLPTETDQLILIRNANKAPLYHLTFFTKNQLGKKFWNASKKGTETQRELF